MEIDFYLFSMLPHKQQLEVANTVSEYTNGAYEDDNDPVEMLPVTPEEVMAKALGLVALTADTKEFVGFIAANELQIHQNEIVSEVGTLVVDKDRREHGAATKLVSNMTMILTSLGIKPYAFCNKKSGPIFSNEGYVSLCAWQVPQSALDWCVMSCKKKPFIEELCCDQILGYQGADND